MMNKITVFSMALLLTACTSVNTHHNSAVTRSGTQVGHSTRTNVVQQKPKIEVYGMMDAGIGYHRTKTTTHD
ncbi:hypothetical protein F9B74_08560 [Pelistega sp. NLN82]|uniref:Lipoprotein n=1 Tax=Pelistega ratti TaxID=2652177 RepID=A0A6L9Y9A7_9BURK|nr:hypothetical protein [Pelistega ratti]NEN76368.1 hypothetical protein [Pelistega ratti]